MTLKLTCHLFLYLIDYSIHIDTFSMELSISYFKGSQVENYILLLFMSLIIGFILANSADLDEMLTYTAFHLGLRCLPKYVFTGIQNKDK